MKISVIIPTYKPQNYLWECLDSLKNQTFSKENFEIILVLNGCNEPYNSLIKEYIRNHFVGYNVNYIQTNQGGVSKARNIALDNAKGEYVTFIDDDDYVSPTYLEELYTVASPEIVSLSNTIEFIDGDVNRKISSSISDTFIKNAQLGVQSLSKARKYFSGPCMKLISISFIQNRRFDVKFKNGEDSLFMFLISDRIKYINYTSRDAIYFRRHRKGSATKTERCKDVIISRVQLIKAYSVIYFSKKFKYNFYFYLTRVLASIKVIISSINNFDTGRL